MFPSLNCSWGLLLTVVFCFSDKCCFSGVVRPSSLVSDAGGVVSVSVLDEVDRVAAGSSTVFEGDGSASEVLWLVTRSLVESFLDVRPPPPVPPSVSPVVDSRSPSSVVDALGPEFGQLSVASLSPGPVDICLETAATVVDG